MAVKCFENLSIIFILYIYLFNDKKQYIKMIVEPLNAVPIARVELPNFISQKEIDILEDYEMKKITGSKFANVSLENHILNNKKLKNLKKGFDEQANHYMKNVLGIDNEIYVSQSWTTKSSPGGHHPQHAHKGCLFSCVYYVYGTAKIFFNFVRSRINEQMNFGYDIGTHNVFNSEVHWYKTFPGLMIIFPAHILHEARDIESDKLIIGANYFVKGFIGKNSPQVDKVRIKPY